MHIVESPFPDIVLPDMSVTEQVMDGLSALTPDRAVLIDGPSGREVTAAALIDSIKRLAGGLSQRGLGAGHTTALMAPNSPEFVTVFHGVAWAGGTVTTVNPSYTHHEVRQQLTDSAADLLVTVPDCLDTAVAAIEGTPVRHVAVIGAVPAGEGAVLALDDLMGPAQDAQHPVDLARHVVVLPYSSGTTGLPKGVMLSHRNLTANVAQLRDLIAVAPGDLTVGFLPLFHIYGLTVLMNFYLSTGAGIVTMPRFDLEQMLRLIQTYRTGRLYCVPPVALALAKHPLVDQFDLSSLRAVYSAAAPVGAATTDAVAARLGCMVTQGYGMTELSPVSHFTPDGADRPGACGLLTPGASCRIVDKETGQDLGCNQAGELWVKGPQVMLGYLNRPDATAETITPDGWLRTGDLASIDDDGYLFIHDRVKELIKVKGFQVAPAEVEAVLLLNPDVADAAVIGIADPEAGEVPVAFVVPAPGCAADSAAILAHAAERLAHYKHPRRVMLAEAIPKSASGKILRRLLRDRIASETA